MKIGRLFVLCCALAIPAYAEDAPTPGQAPIAAPLPPPRPENLAPPHAPLVVDIRPNDAQNVTQICNWAMEASTLSLEQKTNVGMFCQDLTRRLAPVNGANLSAPTPGGEKK